MCGFSCKKKERKVLNSSLYSLTHRNARILKLVSLRVRRIMAVLFILYTQLNRGRSRSDTEQQSGGLL